MTGLLVSVRSVAEAEVALAGGADVIDLKEPASGALGRVPGVVVSAVVERIAGRRPISATIGDPPLAGAEVVRRAAAAADLGVDIVKVGLAGRSAVEVAALADAAAAGLAVVAVICVDRGPMPDVGDLAGIGLIGVMLDTASKDGGGLRAHLPPADLGRFVAQAHRAGLVCGLAGSLGIDDIATLAPLGADLLGYRGGLCAAGRESPLDPGRLAAVRAELDRLGQPAAATRIASAVAGAQSAARARIAAVPEVSSARST